jgi:hypothetical protein
VSDENAREFRFHEVSDWELEQFAEALRYRLNKDLKLQLNSLQGREVNALRIEIEDELERRGS